MSNPRTLKPFQPGFDPRRNLKGRPPGKSVKSQIEEVLNRKIEGTVDRTIAHALVEKVIKMALNGDQQMIKLIWEYSDGKPPKQRVNRKWCGRPSENYPKKRLIKLMRSLLLRIGRMRMLS